MVNSCISKLDRKVMGTSEFSCAGRLRVGEGNAISKFRRVIIINNNEKSSKKARRLSL